MRVSSLPASIAFALAFAVGYVVVVASLPVVSSQSTKAPLSTRLRTNSLFGLSALLVVEGALFFCTGLVHLSLLKTNALVLIAVACWVALGWRFIGADASRPGRESQETPADT